MHICTGQLEFLSLTKVCGKLALEEATDLS
jgi:hypothetical protein